MAKGMKTETKRQKSDCPIKPEKLWGLWDGSDWVRSNDLTGSAILAFEDEDEAIECATYQVVFTSVGRLK